MSPSLGYPARVRAWEDGSAGAVLSFRLRAPGSQHRASIIPQTAGA
ncbi:MAG: hypothetical protein OEU26_17505 [Candidatus Tectomicrobia bacterium]|nr:hypothetical protein [Candidatus Tectomicrobia bacterium]